jgi:hypothetical protein
MKNCASLHCFIFLVSVTSGKIFNIHFEPLKLNAGPHPDPAFYSNKDPDLASQNNAVYDPDLQL